MTVSIGWRIGDDCAVLITEEHDGVQETTLRNEERKAKRAAKKKAGAP